MKIIVKDIIQNKYFIKTDCIVKLYDEIVKIHDKFNEEIVLDFSGITNSTTRCFNTLLFKLYNLYNNIDYLSFINENKILKTQIEIAINSVKDYYKNETKENKLLSNENNKKTIVAFFDVDGTIFRDSLLIEHFKMLVKNEFIKLDKNTINIYKKYQEWENRLGDYDDYMREVVDTYVKSLKKLKKYDIKYVAQRVIDLHGEKLYRYARKRIEFHKQQGHKILLISGSPNYLVSKMAEKLGANDYRASIYEFDKNGIFNGNVVPMWDSISKQKALNKFKTKYNIDLENSYAYGDTTGDLTMFKEVGNAIAINPENKLLETIRNDEILLNKVKIIIERKDVIYETNASIKTFN